MKIIQLSIAPLLLLVLVARFVSLDTVSPTDGEKSPFLWQFDTEAPGTLPKDFVVGTLFEGIASDLDLEVSFLPVGGKGDMGGGLIWSRTFASTE